MMSLPYQGNNGRQLYNHVPACSKHVRLPVPVSKNAVSFRPFFLSFMNRQIINSKWEQKERIFFRLALIFKGSRFLKLRKLHNVPFFIHCSNWKFNKQKKLMNVTISSHVRAVFTWLSKGIGFGFTTPFGWLVYLLWFGFTTVKWKPLYS